MAPPFNEHISSPRWDSELRFAPIALSWRELSENGSFKGGSYSAAFGSFSERQCQVAHTQFSIVFWWMHIFLIISHQYHFSRCKPACNAILNVKNSFPFISPTEKKIQEYTRKYKVFKIIQDYSRIYRNIQGWFWEISLIYTSLQEFQNEAFNLRCHPATFSRTPPLLPHTHTHTHTHTQFAILVHSSWMHIFCINFSLMRFLAMQARKQCDYLR